MWSGGVVGAQIRGGLSLPPRTLRALTFLEAERVLVGAAGERERVGVRVGVRVGEGGSVSVTLSEMMLWRESWEWGGGWG